MWSIFCSSGLKTAGGVLFLVSVTCFLALLSVNSDMIIFHYLFAGFNCLQVSPSLPSEMSWTGWFLSFSWPSSLRPLSHPQGPFVFFFRIVFNKEARNAMKYCCSRKRPDHMIKSKAAVSPLPKHSDKIFHSVRHLRDVELSFSYIKRSLNIFIALLQHLFKHMKLPAVNFLDI